MGVFSDLIADGDVGRVTMSFERAIAASFEVHAMVHVTQAEVKRRFDLCCAIFKKLRGDLHWSVARALDKVPEYLGAELAGQAWVPDDRACWMPGDDG